MDKILHLLIIPTSLLLLNWLLPKPLLTSSLLLLSLASFSEHLSIVSFTYLMIFEEESSASSSSGEVVVQAWHVATCSSSSNNSTVSSLPSERQVREAAAAAAPKNDTNTTVSVVGHKRKAGRKKFRETRHPIFRGVRERNGGKWVCEVREPNKKSRIWLGTFPFPDMAARAYDVAALALRGKSAPLNFPDSAWLLPRAKSSSPKDIQVAALQAAESFRPRPASSTCSPSSSSSSSSSFATTPAAIELPQRVKEAEKGASTVEREAAASTTMFMDEEALFNLPGLLDSMAEGMLLTPPSMQQRFSWDDVDRHMDFSLWTD